MSFTDFGTLMLEPFRSSTFVVFKVVAAPLVFSTTFSATFVALPTTLADDFFVASTAFFEVDFAFEAAFFAAPVALSETFFAVVFASLAALAAADTFLATETESPAFWRSPRLAFAIFATVPSLTAVNFFAVAAPTPGNDVMPEPPAFPAIVSPVCP